MAHSQPHIQKLLEDRYYLRDEAGTLLETDPMDMYARVATAVAQAEEDSDRDYWTDEFFELMDSNKFLPNTPTLINAGKLNPGSFSACFVVPVEDSMTGIFDAVKNAAIISKAGGGVGFSFGRLREEGAVVKSTGHKASGPVSFMRVFDTMCDTVSQGGVRRGAMMAVLPIDHPDIPRFIECKDDGVSFSNFNISIGITDDFMYEVQNDGYWEFVSRETLDLNGDEWKARDLWDKIVEHAWKTGDPGLVFLDTINRYHPLDEDVEATNPCGEIPLRPYESCNLGSINLMAYLRTHNNTYTGVAITEFDWDSLAKDIPTMVRFLDDVIEINPFPLPEIEKASKESRKIGLGIMGWADVLLKMQIPYDSDKALQLAGTLMRFIREVAEEASQKLGEEKGLFPLDNSEVTGMFRRNATLLCVAPTGTLSRIAGVSSGIEPNFAWETHHKLADLEYDDYHWFLYELNGRDWPAYAKTANEIHPNWHLAMQAAFQESVDNSISKTINLANEATVDDVYDIYLEAWKLGLKGITIYRDGSKDNQPLNKIEKTKIINIETKLEETIKQAYRKRGAVAVGVTHKIDTGKGKIYITINYSEYHREPVEVFIRLGYAATPDEQAFAEYCGRLISTMLKYNIPLSKITRQGEKIFSDTVFWYGHNSFMGLPKLISYLLKFTFGEALDLAELDFNDFLDEPEEQLVIFEVCPECGAEAVIREAGCTVCQNCGKEKCGG